MAKRDYTDGGHYEVYVNGTLVAKGQDPIRPLEALGNEHGEAGDRIRVVRGPVALLYTKGEHYGQ